MRPALIALFVLSTGSAAADLPLPDGPMVGAARFEQFGCSGCHAVGPQADKVGPNLGRLDLRMPFLDGAAALWNHLPGMVRQMQTSGVRPPRLSGDDLLNLVAFYTTYQYYLTRLGRPGNPAVGEELFHYKACVSCHAVQPGVKSSAPNLSRFGGGGSILELAQAMWNHGPKMQQMLDERLVQRPFFREREMADVLAYLATSGSNSPGKRAYIEPGSPARGARVFATRGCRNCHAIRGEGGAATVAPGERPPPDLGRSGEIAVRDYTDIAALMWNHAVPMWGRVRREGLIMGPLEGTDLADLVAFLFFTNFADDPGDEARGAEIYRARGCASCHGDRAQGVDVGRRVPSLTAASGLDTPWDLAAAMVSAGPAMTELARERGLPWARLAPGEVRHLAAYVIGLRRQAAAPSQSGGLP